MAYLLVRHKVADFSNWKRVFDSHAEAQRQSGLRIQKVLRNLDNPNELVLFFEVTDLEKARGFVGSPEVPRAREDSGVVDTPDIYFLAEQTHVLRYRPALRVAGSATQVVSFQPAAPLRYSGTQVLSFRPAAPLRY